MFSTEIDFHRELRKGDSFTVIYEALTADGEPITWASGNEMTGRVLATEFVNAAVSTRRSGSPTRRPPARGRTSDSTARASAAPSSAARWPSHASPRISRCASTRSCRPCASIRASTTAHRPARRCAASARAWSRWPGGRTATAMSCRSSTTTSVTTVYAHLSRIDVRKGQHIEQGCDAGRSRRHRVGDRSAPALRVQGQRPAAEPALDGQGIRGDDNLAGREGPVRATRTAGTSQLQVAASMTGRTGFSE